MALMTACAAAVLLTLSAVSGIQDAPRAGTLGYTAPTTWRTRPASSSMRVAEFVIPRSPGDAEDAELVVYYFGTGAGTIDANVNRWLGQIHADGSSTSGDARRSTRTVNGLQVTLVDAAGTYVAEVRPGATEHYNKPGFRLRAAVVETPHGPYYIKMTGPAKTMGAADDDFAAFLGSLRYTPNE